MCEKGNRGEPFWEENGYHHLLGAKKGEEENGSPDLLAARRGQEMV
jgi:hypothetical protein